MSDPRHDQLPDDLRPVVSRLQAERLESDPVELDQLKQRVIKRMNRQGRTTMKSRLATGLTLFALVAGSGGALAIGSSGGGHAVKKNAATSQYTPGKKSVKCRKGFHKVKNRCMRNKVVVKKKPAPKRLTGPAFTGAADRS
jgi:hypothetical protein